MTKKPVPTCPNVTPAQLKDEAGEYLSDATCPNCGRYLRILNSGRFRTHKVRG